MDNQADQGMVRLRDHKHIAVNHQIDSLIFINFNAITETNNYSNNNSEHFDNISVHRNVHTPQLPSHDCKCNSSI